MKAGKIGVIGGSGLYEMADLKNVKSVKVKTPFGEPSDEYIIGTLDDREMVFLPRHGRGHRILPAELNFRANIYGMKKLGVEWILSVSAVGSMKEEIAPGHIVVPDQFFDMTKKRSSTFFGNGIVGHVTFADPVCPDLYGIIYQAGTDAGAVIHKRGTYLCIEGPQFSTRAESLLYRKWGVDVIGMTNVTEAKLAREAEICYLSIGSITDYDVWADKPVSTKEVIETLEKNVQNTRKLLAELIPKIPLARQKCNCGKALEGAKL